MIWTTRPRSEAPGNLAVWTEGTGPALVLIHGVGLRAEAWAAVMPHLAPHYTVHAVDMPGHGASPLQGVSDLPDYVARIAAFADTRDGPVRIAGHSMGGIIAVLTAAALPGKVTALAALNTIYHRTPQAAAAVQARAADLATKGPSDPTATLARWFGNAPRGADAESAAACRDWLSRADPTGYATAYTAFARQDGPDDQLLRDLTIPALFMTAAHDPNSTPPMSDAMARLCPRGRAHTVMGSAHMMPMTHSAEAATQMLQTFREAA